MEVDINSYRWTTALNRMEAVADDSFIRSLEATQYNYTVDSPGYIVASPSYLVQSPTFANPPSPSLLPRTREPSARAALVRELLESEKRYLKDLLSIQSYAHSLIQADTTPQNTVFSALNNLLEVQSSFADGLGSTASMEPWEDQNWGAHFVLFNLDFRVYADYGTALGNGHAAIQVQASPNQTRSLLSYGGDIPSILAPPFFRMDFYATFLQNILKYISPDSPNRASALNALVITRRHLQNLYVSYRTAQNACAGRALQNRIRDWKGLEPYKFGKLILEGRFPVQLANTTTESIYHVYLFEKIILCCKGADMARVAEVNKAMDKLCGPGSSAKRSPSPPNASAPGDMVLKGRISLRDLTQIMARGSRGNYELGIWWNSRSGEPASESQIIMLFREEEVLKTWESEIKALKRNAGAFTDDWNVGRGPARGPA